jgi:hypothetical protein
MMGDQDTGQHPVIGMTGRPAADIARSASRCVTEVVPIEKAQSDV